LIENIKTFLENPKRSKICEVIGDNEKELSILQFMLKEYIKGNEDIRVKKILEEVFEKDTLKSFENIKYVKNLIEDGWIINSIGGKISNLTLLELLNTTVSLSVAFLKLLEKGKIDFIIPENRPYTDHLEYLQDEFLRIDLYIQIANLRSNYSNQSSSIKRLQSKLNVIENSIKERIKKTSIELPVLNFIKERELNEKEEIIFLALLKEEYSSFNENIREMNYLLNLISNDEIERIKNRVLLDDNSKLVSEGILEYDEIIGPFGGFNRIYFISEDILNNLIHPKKKLKIENVVKNTLFDFLEPSSDIKEVVLSPKVKKTIEVLLKQNNKRVMKLLKEWGIKKSDDISFKVIFYGHPGTGKTLTALNIAKYLNKPILSLDASKILSMYVGESEKNVRRMFDEYYEIADKIKEKPVLLLNEADQFFSTRTSALNSVDKMHNQMQNIFLDQLEKFDGILIATTNLLENLDKAFSRRFDYKIKFEKPSFKERKKIWELKLPKNADFEDDFDVNKLAKYDLTGAQIELIVKNTALKVAMRKNPIFKMSDFIEEIKKEINSSFDSDKEIGFII